MESTHPREGVGVRTAIVLFTRDLRVHDHPALTAACEAAERVVPLFVLDDAVLARPIASPNKLAFLGGSLADLDRSLRQRGSALVIRRGDTGREVARVAEEIRADALYCSADVSAFARRRLDGLRPDVRAFPGITVVPPGELRTSSGEHYRVFTPYWRRWRQLEPRPPLPPPEQVRSPELASVNLDTLDLAAPTSADLVLGGEAAGRKLLDAWQEHGLARYDDTRDELVAPTSRLGAYLHLGCVSPAEVAARARGATGFLRQLCWRDFHHQVLAAHPETSWTDYHPLGDRWEHDEAAFDAWREGRTGYPIVDAGMRQLLREGWMHNRARLITASFLTRDLYLDWRAGARHFLEWLVDGDIASNQLNWQWVAGTGTTSRRNRVFNPLRQAERYDPEGAYVRRYVPELASIEGRAIHQPWALPPAVRRRLDYPERIVHPARFFQRRKG